MVHFVVIKKKILFFFRDIKALKDENLPLVMCQDVENFQ